MVDQPHAKRKKRSVTLTATTATNRSSINLGQELPLKRLKLESVSFLQKIQEEEKDDLLLETPSESNHVAPIVKINAENISQLQNESILEKLDAGAIGKKRGRKPKALPPSPKGTNIVHQTTLDCLITSSNLGYINNSQQRHTVIMEGNQ